ncbi:MAG: MFS transporter [Flavobacteriales bacterium]|nr:MFS transporter [Flavobacteriales bacterium]
MQSKTNYTALITLISVFFFWGFVAASNTVLIGLFKKSFTLTQFQSQLVDLAFYAAYFIGSLFYFLISYSLGDPLNKIGYKKGLITGLLISAVGAIGFIPAANMHSFFFMLTSLFVVGLGFALQQIVANPYIIALGSPETGSHRINLAGGINSFGTTIGPLLISFAIFGNISGENAVSMGVEGVKLPYAILSFAFIFFALLLGISKLPAVTNNEVLEKNMGALKYPQLLLGMLAIFIYVGVEVSIQSNLPALMENAKILGLPHTQTVHFISLYWGSLMIGRWAGAISAFSLSKQTKMILTTIMPLMAYSVILLVNYIKGSPLTDLLFYFPFILILIAGFYLSAQKPAKTMILFGSIATLLMLTGLFSSGKIALYAFISGGLFCSVMWPCIFSLSLAGLGKYTNQASSLLIMMILGGAVIPPLQGIIADNTNIHISYIIPVVCFIYLAFYGWKVRSILKQQGINYDDKVESH